MPITKCIFCGIAMPYQEAHIFEGMHRDTCYSYVHNVGHIDERYPWPAWYESWDIKTYLKHKGLK